MSKCHLFCWHVVSLKRHYKNCLQVVEPHSNGTLNLNELCEQANDLNTAISNGKLSNGKMYRYVANTDAETDLNNVSWIPKFGTYREPLDSIQNRKLPELPKTPESTGKYKTTHESPDQRKYPCFNKFTEVRGEVYGYAPVVSFRFFRHKHITRVCDTRHD